MKIKDNDWILWIVFPIVILLFVVFLFLPYVIVEWVNIDNAFPNATDGKITVNEIGDSLGMANAFFSSMAFAGVIVTLLLQMRELRAQRVEMIEMQRVQMMHSRINCLMSSMNGTQQLQAKMELEELLQFEERHVRQYLLENELITFQQALSSVMKILQLMWTSSHDAIVEHINNNKELNLNTYYEAVERLKFKLGIYCYLSKFTNSEKQSFLDLKKCTGNFEMLPGLLKDALGTLNSDSVSRKLLISKYHKNFTKPIETASQSFNPDGRCHIKKDQFDNNVKQLNTLLLELNKYISSKDYLKE